MVVNERRSGIRVEGGIWDNTTEEEGEEECNAGGQRRRNQDPLMHERCIPNRSGQQNLKILFPRS